MTFWWAAHIDTWNETDSSRRRNALAELVLLDGARYTDPMMSSTGPKGFAEMIGAFQAQMPGLTFERVGGIDATGAMVRFSWRLVDATGRQLASGTDDRRIFDRWSVRRHYGFSRQYADGPGVVRGEVRRVLGRAGLQPAER
jgi:hypothetical protein